MYLKTAWAYSARVSIYVHCVVCEEFVISGMSYVGYSLVTAGVDDAHKCTLPSAYNAHVHALILFFHRRCSLLKCAVTHYQASSFTLAISLSSNKPQYESRPSVCFVRGPTPVYYGFFRNCKRKKIKIKQKL